MWHQVRGEAMKERWLDLVRPGPTDDRPVEEIVMEVTKRMGVEVRRRNEPDEPGGPGDVQ